jgi:nucleoid-associated protein YgaU
VTGTWTVQPGEHFWSIAEARVAGAIGRDPTDGETAGYWAALVAANRPLLPDPADPDLIFSGQVLVLPPTS